MLLEKVLQYFRAKQGLCEDKLVKPLFSEIETPSAEHVGHLIKLEGGHTKEFSWREEGCLDTHLINAGFGDYDTSNYLQERAIEE